MQTAKAQEKLEEIINWLSGSSEGWEPPAAEGENMGWPGRAQPHCKGGGQAQRLRAGSAKGADHQASKSMALRQIQGQAGKSIRRSGSGPDLVITGQVHGRE